VIVSFDIKLFMDGTPGGSQQAGGIPDLKNWIVNLDKGFVQVPLTPMDFELRILPFELFQRSLAERGC